jgi:hypothetical protein
MGENRPTAMQAAWKTILQVHRPAPRNFAEVHW